MPRDVLVLCPMRIERDHVAKALRNSSEGIRLVQTGIGKDAIVATLAREASSLNPDALVILAGAAGGLTHLNNDVPPIARVIDTHGSSWTPSVCAGGPDAVTVVAVDHIVEGPADKRALHERTGASVVDMESHAFAAACIQRGLSWCVVRGVSDTPNETLPAEVLGWIDPAGNTRTLRAVRDLALKPSLVPHIVSVVKRSSRVLPRVGARVAELAHAWQKHAELVPGGVRR